MAAETRKRLVREDTTTTAAAATVAVGLAAILFAVGLAALFELVDVTGTLAGLPAIPVLGALLCALGVAVLVFGAVSRLGYVETDPDRDAGIVAAVAFAAVWFVVGALVAAVQFSLPLPVWLVVGAAAGSFGFLAAALPREDVGSTLPAGVLAVLAGVVFLTGLIGPEWMWKLDWAQQASFTATFVVPTLTMFCEIGRAHV